MTQVYRTLRVAPSDEGVLSVVIDAPPMNLIGPELVRDLVTLLGELESDEDGRVLDFNPAAERIFGVPRDEVLGEDMAEVMIPPSLRDRAA